MPIGPGSRLGPYEVTALVGEGGMGKVWRAHHTGLKRDDALKVLPDAFVSDPDRLARFRREAQVLASLNHPNVAHVYGLEQADGSQALVMELVEGPTLADRIAQGRIPVDEALPIAKQIAEALEAAHEQGIIHRDLKPANIKLRPDGTVKVLDFGVAKAVEPASGRSLDATASPTLTSPATITGFGVLLGTAAYMSPEQARSKPVDKRADIWAFGCVLYEMLTGKRAFPGDEVSEVLASVLAREPDWTQLPRGLSPTLGAYIRRCLHKDAKQRIPDIGAMRLALEGVFETAVSQSVGVAADVQPLWRRLLPFVGVAIATGVVVSVAMWSLRPSGESRAVMRFDYVLPGDQRLTGGTRNISVVQLVAVSPDDRHFVYSTDAGFYLRTMRELQAQLIPGTEGGVFNPVFSPDGESVGYFVLRAGAGIGAELGEVRRIAISGGAPMVVAKMEGGVRGGFYGASWGADNTILFGSPAGIWRVSANGGNPELAISAKEGEAMGSPRLLPDGESVLFSLTTATGPTRWDQARIVVQSLRTGARTEVWQGGSDARYVPTGHLVYAVRNDLFAVAFDVDRLTVSGRPVPVVQGVQRSVSPHIFSDTANYGVSNRGRLVYLASGAMPGFGGLTSAAPVGTLRTLVWVNRNGREEAVAAPPRPYSYPRLSPDGMHVAVDVRDPESDIWVWSVARATLTRLTFDPRLDRFPVWSPDGRRIAFSSQRDGSRGNPFWQAADGTGQAERLADARGRQVFPVSFTPDGMRLLVHGDVGGSEQDDVHLISLSGERAVTPLLETMFNERNPEVSPDGRWLAYESDESGRPEVYVRPFRDINGGRWQVSTDGGALPVWAHNGRELFYQNGDALMSVPIETGASFVYRNPVALFKGQYAPSLGGRNYDISPNGQRFLMLKVGAPSADSQEAAPARFIIVENWFEELKRLVPAN